MQVVNPEGWTALCEGRGERRQINMMFIGEQPAGTWVLVHLDTAREVLDEAYAAQINEALDALEAVMRGEPIDAMFADLTQREHSLPPELSQASARPLRHQQGNG
jgi:hydrogenase expression/formation protein HypC